MIEFSPKRIAFIKKLQDRSAQTLASLTDDELMDTILQGTAAVNEIDLYPTWAVVAISLGIAAMSREVIARMEKQKAERQ